MAHILIITNSKDVKAQLSKLQIQKFDWEVIVKNSYAEAISLFEILSDVELIICKDIIDSDPAAEKICNYLLKNISHYPIPIPVIILGEQTSKYQHVKTLAKEAGWDKVFALAKAILDFRLKSTQNKEEVKEEIKENKIGNNFKFDEMFSFDQPIDEEELERAPVAKSLKKAVMKKQAAGEDGYDLEDVVMINDGVDEETRPRIIMNKKVIQKLDSLVKMLDTDKVHPMFDPLVVGKLDNLLKLIDSDKAVNLVQSIANGAHVVPNTGAAQSALPVNQPAPAPPPVLERKLPINKPKPALVEAVAPTTSAKEESEYIPIGTRYFLNMTDIPITMDIYTRTQNGSGFAYVKIFSINEKINRVTVEQYVGSGVKDLYVHRSQHNKTLESLNHVLISKYKLRNMPNLDKMQLNSDSYQVVLEVFKNLEINNYAAELISESLKTMKNLVRLPEALDVFLSGLKERKICYSYSHCHFTCLILNSIVGGFSWSNKDTKDIVVYLSYFHDLALHNDRLIRCHHYYFQEEEKLTEEEKNIILNHADAANKILGKVLHTAFDLATLLREHHGIKTGIGFTELLSTNVSPICMVMIVVEEFVTCYLDVSDSGVRDLTTAELGAIITALEDKYSMSVYFEAVKALKKMFIV